jgi:hypothetical protein
VGDRRAQQGAGFTVGAAGVGGFRLRQGQLFGEVMKLLSCGSSCLIRASSRSALRRKTFVGESAGDLGQSQLMHCRLFPLVDDFRNQVQAVFDRWCDGLVRSR